MDRCVTAVLGLAALGSAALIGLTEGAAAYTVYVSNEKANTVSVIDTDTMAVTATWKVGRRPRGITVRPDGKEVFVCASDDDRIYSQSPRSGSDAKRGDEVTVRGF